MKRDVTYFVASMGSLAILFFFLNTINGGAFFELSFGVRLAVYVLVTILELLIWSIVDKKLFK